ncbi:hypothetical protein OFBG_01375 [Oxalobacter formigenes OXCC13]|uniref:Integrase DNA-binding domain-containing protein n=2 Tax=Oxalobacter formigenes TaxID=847 RepID=C3XAX1_OXAFO|nr:hypothetical protein OFBG_01375 [Oxalobacter formigenes OXCC13]
MQSSYFGYRLDIPIFAYTQKGSAMAKIIVPLNQKQIDNAKPKEKSYSLFDGGGLYMEVSPKGSKLWRMKFRQNGKA